MDQDAYVQGWLVQAGVREEQERSQGRLVAPTLVQSRQGGRPRGTRMVRGGHGHDGRTLWAGRGRGAGGTVAGQLVRHRILITDATH